jgi:hypothetical protein
MVTRTDGSVLVLTETGILWRSDDDGANFTSVSTLTASNHVSLTADDGGGNLYVLTRTGEVARSSDDGNNWTVVGAITTSEAVDIRTNGLEVYVLTASGSVAKSSDQGANWVFIGTFSQVHSTSLTRDDGDFVAATSEGLIANSADGVTWSFVGSINQLSVVALGNDLPKATGIDDRPPPPSTLLLRAPFPNPLGQSAETVTFSFYLPEQDRLSIELYDIRGRLIARHLLPGLFDAGENQAILAVRALTSGIYFARVTTERGFSANSRITVTR